MFISSTSLEFLELSEANYLILKHDEENRTMIVAPFLFHFEQKITFFLFKERCSGPDISAQRHFRSVYSMCIVLGQANPFGSRPWRSTWKSPGSYAADGPDARCFTPSAAHGHDFDTIQQEARRRLPTPQGSWVALRRRPFFVPSHFELSLENLVLYRSGGQAPISWDTE